MKAVAITRDDNIISFQDIYLPVPDAKGHDLLVEVKAISINPVDTKIRQSFNSNTPRVLGWDAVGVVKSIGDSVTLFKPRDEVWYAGALNRPGSNSEYQLVDERIVALKPKSLDDASAAALPLTAITAWEMLFDRLCIQEGGNEGDIIMIIGAAGGVGSVLTQLARKLTKMTVIGTASRPESREWVHNAGAHYIIDHSKPLTEELSNIGIKEVTHVASLNNTEHHYQQIVNSLAPQGKFTLIDDPQTLDVVPLKNKSISLHWEFMFTRSMFVTQDILAQHHLLTRIADLIDKKIIYTTMSKNYGSINAANIQEAHKQLETGHTIGKIILEGF